MKEFRFALKKVAPVLFSYIFVGIASGLLLKNSGYSAVWAFLSGLLIYAGSMQIVMVPLLAAGTPLLTLAVMALFINGRHIFYGIGFVNEFSEIKKKSRLQYIYMMLTVTDETYSVLCSLDCPKEYDRHKAEFYVLALAHILWILSCTLGAAAGEIIPFDTTGIEFSATVFFVCIVVDQWRRFPSKIPALTGAVCAALMLAVMGRDSFLIPALILSLIILVVLKDRVTRDIVRGGIADD